MSRSGYDTILVMGAGGVGGYFGGRMAERTGRKVILIARGSHLKAIQEEGLKILSPEGDVQFPVTAFEDPRRAPAPDLVLFTVKSYDTEGAIEQIRPIVTGDTQILTIQNGIENYDKLVDAFGKKRVIPGFCQIGVGIKEPGVIEHHSFGIITVGEEDGSVSGRLRALKKLFEDAKIEIEISRDIHKEIWMKFSWNSVFNIVTAIAEVPVDEIFRHPEARDLCGKLFSEIRQIADKEGVTLTREDKRMIIDRSGQLENFITSTYRDRMKGKKMEYDAFTGAILRYGEKHGISVPHNETLYSLLKLID